MWLLPAAGRMVKAGNKHERSSWIVSALAALSASFLSVFLSLSLSLSSAAALAVFCEGDSVVTQLGLSSLSSDLSGTHLTVPFLASPANTHTYTYTVLSI